MEQRIIYSDGSEHSISVDCPTTVEIFDTIEEAIKKHKDGYGCDLTVLSKEHLTSLMSGKVLVMIDGEYTHYIMFNINRKN